MEFLVIHLHRFSRFTQAVWIYVLGLIPRYFFMNADSFSCTCGGSARLAHWAIQTHCTLFRHDFWNHCFVRLGVWVERPSLQYRLLHGSMHHMMSVQHLQVTMFATQCMKYNHTCKDHPLYHCHFMRKVTGTTWEPTCATSGTPRPLRCCFWCAF